MIIYYSGSGFMLGAVEAEHLVAKAVMLSYMDLHTSRKAQLERIEQIEEARKNDHLLLRECL